LPHDVQDQTTVDILRFDHHLNLCKDSHNPDIAHINSFAGVLMFRLAGGSQMDYESEKLLKSDLKNTAGQ